MEGYYDAAYIPWVEADDTPDTSYRRLWLSVLHLASEDAEGLNGSDGCVVTKRTGFVRGEDGLLKPQDQEIRWIGKKQRAARKWLTEGSRDFMFVCLLAGIDGGWALRNFRVMFGEDGERRGRQVTRRVRKG